MDRNVACCGGIFGTDVVGRVVDRNWNRDREDPNLEAIDAERYILKLVKKGGFRIEIGFGIGKDDLGW